MSKENLKNNNKLGAYLMSSNNLLDTTRRYVEDAFGCFTKTNHYAHDKFYEKLADQVLEGVGFRNKHNRFAGYNDKQQEKQLKKNNTST